MVGYSLFDTLNKRDMDEKWKMKVYVCAVYRIIVMCFEAVIYSVISNQISCKSVEYNIINMITRNKEQDKRRDWLLIVNTFIPWSAGLKPYTLSQHCQIKVHYYNTIINYLFDDYSALKC